MSRKILKFNAFLLTMIGAAILSVSAFYLILVFIQIPEPNSLADGLSQVFALYGLCIAVALNSPIIVAGISTLQYIKEGKYYPICIISNLLGTFLYGLFIIVAIIKDSLDIFEDFTTGNSFINIKIIITAILFMIIILPFIINIFILVTDKHNISIKNLWNKIRPVVIIIIIIIIGLFLLNIYRLQVIKINKKEITENNTYTYADFDRELTNRNFKYVYKTGMKGMPRSRKVLALDSENKYGYEFTNSSYTNSYTISTKSNRKFPLFVYETYESLIEKSSKTASYYAIGPEDWYITWYIYYVDGQIYAAIGDESELGSNWETSLSTTEYGIIVSETEKITTYNAQENYYDTNGCITDTRSGNQRGSFPTISNKFNKNCMNVRVVDKVDAKTLDSIAKELSPQYWKEYKNNN